MSERPKKPWYNSPPRLKSDNDATAYYRPKAWYQSWAWTLFSFLGAGAVGALLMMELRAGPILASLAGLGTYGYLAFVLPQAMGNRNKSQRQVIVDTKTDDDPRVELLVEAHQYAATLAAARAQLPLAIGGTLDRLHIDTIAIIDAVSANPEKLGAVLRFFTYYLPSTADLVMDRIKLAPHAGSARLKEIDQTLGRLAEAFEGFKKAVLAPELEDVDLDIELLDKALRVDLEDLKR